MQQTKSSEQKNEPSIMKQTIKNYLMAKEYHKRIQRIDQESKKTVLKNNVFLSAGEVVKEEKGERILNPSGDYEMGEEDFKKYLELCHAERTKRGLKVPNANTTSDFESWKLLKKAEDLLVSESIRHFPEQLKQEYETIDLRTVPLKIRAQFIELCINYYLAKGKEKVTA